MLIHADLYLMAPFNRFGAVDSNSSNFAIRNFVHSCMMSDFSCSAVRGLILLFILHHAFSIGESSRLGAGQ